MFIDKLTKRKNLSIFILLIDYNKFNNGKESLIIKGSKPPIGQGSQKF